MLASLISCFVLQFLPRARGHAVPSHLSLFNTEAARRDLVSGVELLPSTSTLSYSGEELTVSWSGLEDVTGKEFIAWYSPASAMSGNLTLSSPVKYSFLSSGTCGNDGCSSGSLRFRMLNLHDTEGYGVGLFTGGLDAPVMLAETESAITFTQPVTEVTQKHLAFTGVESEMRVSWTTGGTDPSAPGDHNVQWWPSNSPDDKQMTKDISTVTYRPEDLCGYPATTVGYHSPGLLHSVIMTSLLPGTTYEYSVDGELLSGEFRTPEALAEPAPDMSSASAAAAASQSVRLAVFGDLGTAAEDSSTEIGLVYPASLKTTTLLKNILDGDEPFGLVLHIGDLSYARGYDTQWDQFMAQIEPVASRVPWMVAAGNHERDSPGPSASNVRSALSHYQGTDSGGECGVPQSFRFKMPAPADDPIKDKPWYSFNYGPIHFTVMSTEHDYAPGSEQYLFIAGDFIDVDRDVTPWLILAGHRPMYVDSVGAGADPCPDTSVPCPNDQPVANELREALEELMLTFKVDLVFWGHHHSYQRTCPVIGGKCVSFSSTKHGHSSTYTTSSYTAPIHVIVGMAGADLTTNIERVREEPTEYVNDWQHGLAILEADSTTLKLRLHLTPDGTVGDEIVLIRPANEEEDARDGLYQLIVEWLMSIALSVGWSLQVL